MPDLLLEIGTYEMSPDQLSPLTGELFLRAGEALTGNGLREGSVRVLYTPRRLALIARDLVCEGADEEETDDTILRALTDVVSALVIKEAHHQEGSPGGSIPQVSSLVCLYGERVVPLCIRKLCAGRTTRGHWRVAGEKEVVLSCAADYEEMLASAGVVVDPDRRKRMVREAIAVASREVKAVAQVDDDLLSAIALCTEFPRPVIGEVLLPSDLPMAFAGASLREAGFVPLVSGNTGRIQFVGFTDGPVKEEVVRAGFERVARSELWGCQLLFERDRETTLAAHVRPLREIADPRGLGSLWEKMERLRAFSGEIARVVGASAEVIDRAAFLCLADLSTQIVHAFPELHGIAGATYAVLDGEDARVCSAIEEAALAGGNSARRPTHLEGLVVAIASEYDDIVTHLLAEGDAQDPVLVNLASDLTGLIVGEKLDIDPVTLLDQACEQIRILSPVMKMQDLKRGLRACLEKGIAGYLETVQGVSTRIRSALPREVKANPYRSSLCAKALQEASVKEGFSRLLVSIAKLSARLEVGEPRAYDPALFETEGVRSLWREYLKAEGKVGPLLAQLDYERAIEDLISFRGAIDRYLDDVDLHAGSDEVRENSLGLISAIVDLYARVADFDMLVEDQADNLPQAEREDEK